MYTEPPVFPGRLEPNDRFRDRRRRARRRRGLRRLAVLCLLIGGIVALALNARFIGGGGSSLGPGASATPTTAVAASTPEAAPRAHQPVRPAELRGVHVTGPLIAAGKLDEYIALKDSGLNALQIDIKDENGHVGMTQAPALARKIGAAQDFYDARAVARKAHAAGLYVIGRIVVFEDPKLAAGRPDLALQNRDDGSVWSDGAGWQWVSQYSSDVWDYNVAIARAAAKAGFDEIMFDYVRFPSDDVTGVSFPGRASEARWRTIANFVQYAAEHLHPAGVRVGVALFGLAATTDLGIGQRPQLIGKHVDTVYAMTYPCLYGPGWYGLDSPWANPAYTVSRALLDFTRKLAGRPASLVPWLQDYDCTQRGLEYTPELVEAQVSAARRAQTGGFLLWNPYGEYTAEALAPKR